MITILGVDPGLATCGLSLVEIKPDDLITVRAAAVFVSKKSDKKRNVGSADDTYRRLLELATWWSRFVGQTDIDAVCAESMSYPRSSVAACMLGMCWGQLARFALERAAPLVTATPQEIKLALCGRRDASKELVETAVRAVPGATIELDGIKPGLREHAADSIGAVLACRRTEVIKAAMR